MEKNSESFWVVDMHKIYFDKTLTILERAMFIFYACFLCKQYICCASSIFHEVMVNSM